MYIDLFDLAYDYLMSWEDILNLWKYTNIFLSESAIDVLYWMLNTVNIECEIYVNIHYRNVRRHCKNIFVEYITDKFLIFSNE